MQIFDYNATIRVIFGESTLNRLGELATELGGRRALMVTDSGIVQSGHVETATRALRKASIETFVHADVEENPTTAHVENGVKFAQQHGPLDMIIALGGGSALDCAKGINFLLTNGGKMEDYWGFGKATRPMLPSIGIPTTAGTGSEAQSYALISQEKTHVKMACGDLKARFKTVILDPTLLRTAPKQIAAITGIDAISHALESYVSTKRNPLSQMFAREAWRLLVSHFELFLQQPQDLSAAGNMLLGAHLAGAAIENSMLGAVHACANPLTAHYGITHGIAVGLMLPHVIEFNSELVNGFYEELVQAAGWQKAGNISGANYLVKRINLMKTEGGMAGRLREFQVEERELPVLAKEAAEQWTGKFNPRKLSEQDFLKLYENAY